MSSTCWSLHKVKRSVSALLAGQIFKMSDGLAECEWIKGVLESAVCQDYEPSLRKRKLTRHSDESKVAALKVDSHLQVDPPAERVPDAKIAFDQPVRETTVGHCRRTVQELCEIQRSRETLRERCRGFTTRADRYRRIDEESWQQITTLPLLRGRAHSIEDEDQELAMKKTYRE